MLSFAREAHGAVREEGDSQLGNLCNGVNPDGQRGDRCHSQIVLTSHLVPLIDVVFYMIPVETRLQGLNNRLVLSTVNLTRHDYHVTLATSCLLQAEPVPPTHHQGATGGRSPLGPSMSGRG